MRKALLVILIHIHILGNTEVSQLLRIPNLVDHYFEHCRINPSISFFQFLSMHYGGNDGTDADNDRDNSLPCHNLHHNTLTVLCYKIQDSPSEIMVPKHVNDRYLLPATAYVPEEPIFSFFQPPKLA
jgi:hypothetical protein